MTTALIVMLTMCTLSTPSTCQDINAGQLRLSNPTECWVAAQPLAEAWIADNPGWQLANVQCF